MKTDFIKKFFLTATVAVTCLSCTDDDDFEVHNFTPTYFAEDFSVGARDNKILNTPGWLNYAEAGTMLWKEQIYSGNAYAEFSAFQSNEISNIGWLISPEINLDVNTGEKLLFLAGQAYVTSGANSLEILISSDFDGTEANITSATWQSLTANLPTTNSTYFELISSGEIDLSSYTGNVHIAFKVKGSGTNTALDGSYQIDNIRIIY